MAIGQTLLLLGDLRRALNKAKPMASKSSMWSIVKRIIQNKKRNFSHGMCTFKIQSYKLFKLDKGPPIEVTMNKQDAIKMYIQMQSIRILETNIANLYKSKHVTGACHLCNGQEACTVGIYQAMRSQDMVISSYRVHGWSYMLSQNNARAVIAELLAKKTGVSKGKGGSMHMYATNFYGGNGIVGAQVPLGAGLAFAAKYLDTKAISFALYGDGASNQGQVFEAFNMAKLWDLPVVFVCENNGYGLGTSSCRSSANTEYYKRGDYIPGILVDGIDVLAVREASKFAIDYCTEGNGPIILELKTYRYISHSMSNLDTSYMTRDEKQQVKEPCDPIKAFINRISESNLVSEEELKQIDSEIKKRIDDATQQAFKDAEHSVEALTCDIYKHCVEPNIRGITEYENFKHSNSMQKA